jgi:hypothetical protein
LQAFLKDYPSGALHDQISGRLDDVVWKKTPKNDLASLRAYVSRFPGGSHISQARSEIERLTAPPVRKETPTPVVDQRAAVLEVVAQYTKAYEDKSIEELKQIWPGMDRKQTSSMRDFFRTAKNVKSTYTILEEPQINDAEATVKFTQVTTFISEGQPQRLSGTRTLNLSLNPGTSGGWKISSVTGD